MPTIRKEEIIKQPEINFIGIGAQKSGTTWLHYNLSKLPEFALPPKKEIHYFDRNTKYSSTNILSQSNVFKRLLNLRWAKETFILILKSIFYLNGLKWTLRYCFSNYNDKWYLSLFNKKGIQGEITPSYSLLEKEDIARMYKIAPKAKLILILRNPVDRAWSQYRFSTKNRGLKNNSFDAKKQDKENQRIISFMNSEGQTKRSDYLSTLDNYYEIYPKDQILICLYDAIADCPERLLKEIVDFIGGDSETITKHCQLEKKLNVSNSVECHSEVHEHLQKMYHKPIKQLANKYGGYFNVWLEKTYNEKSTNKNNSLFPTLCIEHNEANNKR